MFNKTSKLNQNQKWIYLLIITASMTVITFKVFSLFFFLSVFFVLLYFVKNGEISFSSDYLINILFASVAVSSLLAMFSNIPMSYKKGIIVSAFLMAPVYFVAAVICRKFRDDQSLFRTLSDAIVLMGKIQIVWCLIQFAAYKAAGLDLNQIIFSDIFHFVESASHYKASNGELEPSGFGWHPSIMAPLTVMTYCFSNNIIWKVLAVAGAIVSGNSTSLLGILICILLNLFFRILHKSIDSKAGNITIYIFAIAIIAGIPLLIKSGIFEKIMVKVALIFQRIIGTADDGGSADAHMRYYQAYPQVIGMSSPLQLLFGYGLGCSGYPFSVLFNQYSSLKSWAVESDIMNILISRGILGFICYYAPLIYIIFKGYKINYLYVVVMLTILLEGITYNVQYDYVFFIELLMYIAVKHDIDLFQLRKPAGEKNEYEDLCGCAQAD